MRRAAEERRVPEPEWVGEPEGLDPARLTRGLSLRVQREGYGRFRVWGGEETHWVDLVDPAMPRCDCGDHLWRGTVCKHLLAALLREGDERVVEAVGALVRTLAQAAAERRRTRVTGAA
jgi:hypothetical protein